MKSPGGKGVYAAFDFVGVTPTINTAMQSMAAQGRLTVLGIAGQPYEWTFYTTPYEVELTNSYWGTIEDLHEVAELFRAGSIAPKVTKYPMDKALDAYQDLVDGKVSGRAVVTPNA